jgi:hypothetical protein
MTPEQQQLTQDFLTAAADASNTVDVEDIAQSAFALMVWALNRGYFDPDKRDFLISMFTTQLPQRVASMLEESGHQVECASVN